MYTLVALLPNLLSVAPTQQAAEIHQRMISFATVRRGCWMLYQTSVIIFNQLLNLCFGSPANDVKEGTEGVSRNKATAWKLLILMIKPP